MLSILFSSYKRVDMFLNTLQHLKASLDNIDYEIVIADENSDESEQIFQNIKSLKFLRCKFISVNMDLFTERTGVKKYYNNPSVTNNIAFKHCGGDIIALQGTDILVNDNTYIKLLSEIPKTKYYIVYSTTLGLDAGGQPFTVLQHPSYLADVTNYLSLCSWSTWNDIGGYDETFIQGVACEDSDFSRRARMLPSFQRVMSNVQTYHKWHGTTTQITEQSPLYEGQQRNRKHHRAWEDCMVAYNRQSWPWGTYGVERIRQCGLE